MGCLDGGSHGSSSWPPFSVWKWGRRWPRWRGRLKSTRMCFTAGGGSSAKGQTQGVVERKTTMPILSSLLCEAKGNRLTITATGLELGIRTGCEAKVKKEGSGTIRMRFAARGAAVGRGPARPTGGQDRPTGAGDRFFEGVLSAHRRAAEAAGGDWKNRCVYQQIQTQRDGAEALTAKRMCALGVSRAGFYHFPPRWPGPDPDLEVRDTMQQIAVEFPSYGWPRMTAELKRRGWR